MTQNDSKSKNIAEPEKKSNDSSNSENDIETFTFRRPKVMPTKKGKSSGWSKNKKNANRMKAIREKESKDEHDQRVKKVSESNKKRKSNLTTAELEFEHDREAKRLRMIRYYSNILILIYFCTKVTAHWDALIQRSVILRTTGPKLKGNLITEMTNYLMKF